MTPEYWADAIWLAHGASTLYMTGLIWFVQRVHYPLMHCVSAPDYAAFQHQHVRRTTGVVGPAMLIEAFTAAALLYVHPDHVGSPVAWTNFVLVLGIWISTAALQVPCHHRLAKGYDARAHHRLVRTNWIRTALWSVRSIAWLLIVLKPG